MKICVTGLRGMPNVMGGVESHCEELLPRIKALQADLEIALLARAPYVPRTRNVYKGITIVPIPSTHMMSLEPILGTLGGIAYARAISSNVVHIHAIGPALLAPLARLLGLKVILTHHGRNYDHAKWGRFAKSMLRLGEVAGISSASAVIAVSESLADDLRTRFPRHAAKVVYIPNGVSDLNDERTADAEDPIEKHELVPGQYIMAVGRLDPEKGFHVLLDAFEALTDERKLVIVGGADYQTDYSRGLLARAGPKVIFTGRQPRATLRRLYRHAGLFVLPSFNEGLPVAALEAAAAALPIILSDIPANRDLRLPAENYFPVGDSKALSEKLRQPPGTYGVDANDVCRRFDWDVAARETIQIYNAVSH